MTKEAGNKEEFSLEELFEQLDKTIHTMEQENISLEDSFQLYHTGMDLLAQCNNKIEKIEKKMLVLDEE